MKQLKELIVKRRLHVDEFLNMVGVAKLPPLSSPVDMGLDALTFESHLEQSAHLMSAIKFCMAFWLVGGENSARQKIAAAGRYKIPVVSGGTPFEIAISLRRLSEYLDLCADMGFSRVETGVRLANTAMKPRSVVAEAQERGLQIQFELRKQPTGLPLWEALDSMIADGKEWLDAGAVHLIVKANEGTSRTGLFSFGGDLHSAYADRFAATFGLHTVMFEAPDEKSQFALLDHFGRDVQLCNVRMENLLSVESYRRGLHFSAFVKGHLIPRSGNIRPQPELLALENKGEQADV